MASRAGLLHLPIEVLQDILLLQSTPSFVQTSICCKSLYQLASNSRNIILYHLQRLPGIKIGLDDPTITTADLFLLLRQRASKHLYGANFNANCLELKSPNAPIDTDASCLAELDKDYVTMSLVLKGTSTVRLYSSHCVFKEKIPSPYAGGGKTKVLQVVQRKSIIAVLYQWEEEEKQKTPPWVETALVKDHPYKKPNNLAVICPPGSDSEESGSDDEAEPPKRTPTKKFHLLFYDSLSTDKPVIFTIDQHKGLVPRHFALSSKVLWAILWDSEDSILPTDDCTILQYNAPWGPIFRDPDCDSQVIWPTEFDPRPVAATAAETDKGLTIKRPKKIAFFKEGRRLSLYAPGDLIPYKVLSVGSHRESRSPTNYIYFENRTVFQVDTSFFGMHESYWDIDEARQYCHVSHLCLGIGEVWRGTNTCQVLCVLRSRSKTDHDDCPHNAELNRMNHVSAENCKAVARLWGWSNTSSTMTGLEMVAVSTHGTRIAIAQWNRVLIWSLDPKILCEDIVDLETEDEGKKAKKKAIPKSNSVAEGFYERTKDKQMGWKIADLKPIVIDLNGAVARKLAWTVQSETDDDSDSDQSSVDGEVPSSQDSVDDDGPDQSNPKVADSDVVEPEALTTVSEFDDVQPNVKPPDPLSSIKDDHPTTVVEEESTPPPKIKPKDEKAQHSGAGISIETTEVCPNKPLPDRVPPSTNTQRSRLVMSEIEALTISPNADTQLPQEPSNNTVSNIEPSAETANTDDSAQVVIDTAPSPLIEATNEPKGKEKELDVTSQPLSIPSSSSEDRTETDEVPKVKVHKKRFTEDHLVIMTDRGFQIWDFGAWSTGQRNKQWLEDEQ